MKFLKPIFFAAVPFLMVPATTSFSQTANTSAHTVSIDPWLKPFYHGVASGDPLPDRVIIWTRVTPDSGSVGPINVTWRMATDTNFAQVVANGNEVADLSRDFTVKVDVTGLQSNTVYYYEFSALGRNSLIGRTKTTPAGDADSLRIAVVSCANFEAGFFNAYGAIKKANDIDAVVMLGDYIYEYESGGYGLNPNAGRTWDPATEILSLADYRTRYSHYHLDKDLRQLHQQFPWILVWDDHETANNSWEGGAENHTPGTEGDWFSRKDAGIEAYEEWLPIRVFPNDTHRIYRTISYGNLMDIVMMDTRLEGRNEQIASTTTVLGIPVVDITNASLNDTARKMISQDQYDWLLGNLNSTSAQWKLLGQQVMVGPLRLNVTFPPPAVTYIVNSDQWDGYPAQRQRFFNEIINNNIDNIVVLTGDIHTSWANDLPFVTGTPYDSTTGAGSAGVEFVGTSVTSPGLPVAVPISTIKSNNPNVRYAELNKKGYVIVDVNKARTQGDFYYVVTLDSANNTSNFETGWYVNDGERFLRQSSTASVGKASLTGIPFAPEFPRFPVGIKETIRPAVILGTYPNPFVEFSIVQFYLDKASDVNIKVVDISGKTIYRSGFEKVSAGLHIHGIDLKNTAEGTYFLMVETDGYTATQKLVKGK